MDHVPPATLAEVLQHERGLRRLAASLLADPADVDDAVQHALVQATAGRRPIAALWPFLRTTVRRHASNLRKLAARRRRHECAAARPEAVPSPAEFAAREQLRRRVADAVQALDEPYRTTVWLRWFEDVDTAAIAARLQVPLATVRSRLQRAHAQLAARLDREFGGRERWAALTLPVPLPLLGVAPAVGAVALTGVAMKKLALAALVLVPFLLGYALWPRAAAPAARPTQPEAAPAFASAPSPVQPDERQELATAPVPAPQAMQLAIRYADGTPARGLPVWFWRDDGARPAWTRRVDPRLDREVAPGAADADGVPPPPPATTDPRGVVLLPAAPADAAVVSVQYAPGQLYSAPRPAPGEPFVLPPLGEVEVLVGNAPPAGRWSALVNPAVLEDDGGQSLYSDLRVNVGGVGGAAGAGVVRIREHRYEVGAGERLRVLLPREQPAGFEFDGHGFGLRVLPGAERLGFEVSEQQIVVRAPALVEAACTGAHRSLAVEVREADGSPLRGGGRCCLARRRAAADAPGDTEQRQDLARGTAAFDEVPLQEGASYDLTVLLDDGEWFRREVQCAAAPEPWHVALPRGGGRQPLRLRLGGATGSIAGVACEAGGGAIAGVEAWRNFFTAALPVFAVRDGEVQVSLLDDGWRQLWIVFDDGRLGSVAAADAVAGAADVRWLPSSPVPDLELGTLFRAHGDHEMMAARLQVELIGSAGQHFWITVASHRRFHRDERVPPPVWRGLRLPAGLQSRIELYFSDAADGAGGTTVALPVPR